MIGVSDSSSHSPTHGQHLDPSAPHGHASFADKIAVVTGGSQGLGFATASLMKARGAAGILLVGRDQEKGDAAARRLDGDGCRVEFASIDLREAGSADAVAERADADFGTVHTAVNCAAITARGTVWNATDEMWDDMLAVNVRAPARLISTLAPIMKRDGVAGTFVLIGSIAHHGGIPELYTYSPSKYALEIVARNAAFSLMPHRIRVNLLNPGWMDTPAEHDIQKRYHDAPDDWLVEAEAAQPFGRLLKPQEIARGICYLASEESGMMTAASIDFDQTIPGVGDMPRSTIPVPEHYPWQD